MTSKAVFIHSPELDRYPYPPDCPFSSQRAGQAHRIVAGMGLLHGDDRAERAPHPPCRTELEQFHTAGYLDALKRAGDGDFDVDALAMGIGTPDCPVFAGMYEYSALACGATLTGVQAVLRGEAHVAFNPSGGYHHAGPEQAAGFCYINDVALACGELARHRRRVAFLDVDAHHADAVQRAFYRRADVLTLSFHESGKTLFPGTGFEDEVGEGDGRGYSVNVPLPAGTYDEVFLRAFDAVAMPLIGAYQPDVIVLELGMDGLSGDPLAHLGLTNNAYAAVVRRTTGFGKPIVATGGGGYHVEHTARGWALAWAVMCGEDSENDLLAGLGGVMLESTDWEGGLRDRARAPHPAQRAAVDAAVDATIRAVQGHVFAVHGL